MTKYRKKPIEVEAVQWTGENEDEVREFSPAAHIDAALGVTCLAIDTLEGRMMAHHGDWIIKGGAGEFYPCKPDIFRATYEAVE